MTLEPYLAGIAELVMRTVAAIILVGPFDFLGPAWPIC